MENTTYCCFNNNMPDSQTEFYHLFDMTVYDGGNFANRKFVFFIPEANQRLKIDSKNLIAVFTMGKDEDKEPIMHPRETTCNPALFILKGHQSSVAFKYSFNDNVILVPMFGFYDGNSQRLPNRLKQHDVYGYFYRCNDEQFTQYVQSYGDQEKEVDFYNDPLINGSGGYFYNTDIGFNEY